MNLNTTLGNVRVSSTKICLLNPEVVPMSQASATQTYQLSTECLQVVADSFADSSPTDAATITCRTPHGVFPYLNANEQPQFTLNVPQPDDPVTISSGNRKACIICGIEVAMEKMREHVGSHIFKEELRASLLPCGYCGGVGTCSSGLTYGSKGRKGPSIPTSTCPLFVKFSITAAEKAGRHCSNRPVQCQGCFVGGRRTLAYEWSYNMRAHYIAKHPGLPIPSLASIPPEELSFMKATRPSKAPKGKKDPKGKKKA